MPAVQPIRSAAVLGAGVMGAQIAAHLANAGVPALLLDLTLDLARSGLKRAQELKPDPLFTPEAASLITLGSFDTDLARLAGVDLVVEAVVERIDVKRPLLERVDAVRQGATIVSSNTSGIPITALGEGRSESFRRHWLGTHFFNPPRYLHLLEIIPTADTEPAVVDRVRQFADLHLGKGVVVARDRPNFIANHIGIYSALQVLAVLESGAYTIEEIDALTGPAIGRPKSATFRTIDLTGVDVLAAVAANLSLPVPRLVQALIERGWIGEKAGQGFYKRLKTAEGSEILTLDPGTLTYRARQPARIPAVEAASAIGDATERLRTLFFDPGRAGAFLRRTLGPTLTYTARIADEIAYSIDDIDRAMRWGFAWELGPFEIWDVLGVRDTLAALRSSGTTPVGEEPPRISALLASGRNRFRDGSLPPAAPGLQLLASPSDRIRVVRRNAGASLVDLGDGVLALEFHSKMNTIGADSVEMIHAGVTEAARNFAALVVANEAAAFSAGANLMLVLLEAQEGNWDEIDLMVRGFQRATTALRFAEVPVVVAPAGLTLGGGCEILLHADRVQAAAESYIGLVETGVGLIPAGGGVKEMLRRHRNVQRVFETIGFARTSTSAAGARRLGFLRDADVVTMNRERLTADAKALALERVREGYVRPQPTPIAIGGEGVDAALKLGIHLAWRAGRISEHDALIGRTLARVMAGGALPQASEVSEQYVLDLEREAFLKLCGEPKTLERIQYTLKTGKMLRN